VEQQTGALTDRTARKVNRQRGEAYGRCVTDRVVARDVPAASREAESSRN
jgi:hypothetical protein